MSGYNAIYGGRYSSIGPCDITAMVNMPIANVGGDVQSIPVPFGTLHTVSVSSFRDKTEVRVLGRVSASGVTGGPRTVAGTLVFSAINEWDFRHIYNRLRANINESNLVNSSGSKIYMQMPDNMYADELPPFDIYILGYTEYGSKCYRIIYGVSILMSSTVIATNNLNIDCTYQYKAIDISPWKSGGMPLNVKSSVTGARIETNSVNAATGHNPYQAYYANNMPPGGPVPL